MDPKRLKVAIFSSFVDQINEMLERGVDVEDITVAVLAPHFKVPDEMHELAPQLHLDVASPAGIRVTGTFFTPNTSVDLWSEDSVDHIRLDLPAPFSSWHTTDRSGHFVAYVAMPRRNTIEPQFVIAYARERDEADIVVSSPTAVDYAYYK
jgi:hypothetical protein